MLSLSFVLSACITTHTCSISLSLSPSVFISLFFLVYLFQSYCLSQSPSLKCLCFECCAHASINLKMPHTVSITHVQCDDSQSPAGYQIQSLTSPPLLSLSVFPSSPLSSFWFFPVSPFLLLPIIYFLYPSITLYAERRGVEYERTREERRENRARERKDGTAFHEEQERTNLSLSLPQCAFFFFYMLTCACDLTFVPAELSLAWIQQGAWSTGHVIDGFVGLAREARD